MEELKEFKKRCKKNFEESPHMRMVYKEITSKNISVMQLQAINKPLFLMLPFILCVGYTILKYDDLVFMVGAWGLFMTLCVSLHISTFKIYAREEDN